MSAISLEFTYLIARAKRDGDTKLENLLREDAFLKEVKLPQDIEALPKVKWARPHAA
jgi:hypothetical protein